MLDRSTLATKLQTVVAEIFVDTTEHTLLAQNLWQLLIHDTLLKEKLAHAHVSWPLPTWQDAIDATHPVVPPVIPYDLISVDGSQIYPDRHSGISCYLINIGEVIFRYGTEKPVAFYTQPYVFAGNNEDLVELSADMINGKRQDLELKMGYERAKMVKTDGRPHLLLFDGSLIFWHLEAKDPSLKELFLANYLATLSTLHADRIICASYISAPKSREIMNVVRTYGCDFDETNEEKVALLARYSDAALLSFVLKPYERTTVFKNHAVISELYPEAVQPHFFYLHVGMEIGRVEIPAWIAHDTTLVDQVAAIMLDQCNKGYGYPVVLAEAHEQAVIKGPDREFFYHLLQKMSTERKRHIDLSPKEMKKRGIGV